MWVSSIGTLRPTCRPYRDQMIAFSGNKRQHGLKFQLVMFPNGINGSPLGPWERRGHDARMWKLGFLINSKIRFKRSLHTICASMVIQLNLSANFLFARMTVPAFPRNKKLSTSASVAYAKRWNRDTIVFNFALLDFKKNQKNFLQNVGIMYAVDTLLVNCINCLYMNGSSTSSGVISSCLEDFLGNYDLASDDEKKEFDGCSTLFLIFAVALTVHMKFTLYQLLKTVTKVISFV